jgi:hypothetical protein
MKYAKQLIYEAQNLLGCTAVFLIETSVDIQSRTRQYIPEDSELHSCRRENLKSHTADIFVVLNWKELERNAEERR